MADLPIQGKLQNPLMKEVKRNFKQYAMFIALLATWGIFAIITRGVFLSPRNLSNLMLQTSHIAILAVGMVLVIVAGHIDLSVGSIAGFLGAVAAVLHVNFGWNPFAAIAVALVGGVIIGAFQGYWIAYRGIPAFIVTLAGMTIFRGALIALTQGATIAPLDDAFTSIGQGFLPRIFTAGERNGFHLVSFIVALLFVLGYIAMEVRGRMQRKKYGFELMPAAYHGIKIGVITLLIGSFFAIMVIYRGIPISVLIVIALVILYTFLTNNTVFGRHVYAIGGNKEAARLSGINIKSKTLWIFISMGFLSALSGVVFTARLNGAAASAGNLFELDTIAAAIIGGTSTLGGQGTVFGAIVGALLMSSVNNGMSLMNWSADLQMVIRGVILLGAVWFDIASRKKGK